MAYRYKSYLMKYVLRVVFLIILCSQCLIAQESPSQDLTEQTSVSPQSIIGDVNLNINNLDSIDLEALDSVLSALDTIINKIPRSSGIYGHDMFESDSLSFFKPGSIVKIPENYVLGVNDEIVVSIFGLSQLEAQLRVDSAGYVKPSEMPKIFMKGITWAKAKSLMKRRYSNYYRFRSDQFVASIIKPRVVTVNVFGEVKQPGTFTFEGTNNAFNALVAAKGPSLKGSVRNIVIHNGSIQRTLDLYQLINKPAAQFDLYLDDNTIIQVPIARKVITLTGAVNRPMKYELTEREGLKDLINYAGGTLPEAALEVVQIKRFEQEQLIVLDQNFEALISQGKDFQLQNGDIVEVKKLSGIVQNSVTVEGAAEVTGEFAISEKTRISDLLKKSKLKREARTDVAYLIRVNPDSTLQLLEISIDDIIKSVGSNNDLVLRPQDKLIINDQSLYVDKSTISVKGAVRQEIEYPFDINAKVKLNQAIALAGGLGAEAADVGYVVRSNPTNRNEKEYIEVNFKSALQNESSSANLNLQPWDQVEVLRSSLYTDVSMVSIQGAVRSPKKIQYAPSLRLKDAIVLAGGLKQEASRNIQVFRINIDQKGNSNTEALSIEVDSDYNIVEGSSNFKLKPYDEIVVRNVLEFELQNIVEIRGEVKSPGPYALTSQNERLASLIKRSGGLTEEAFVEGAFVLRQGEVSSDTVLNTTFKLVSNLKEALSNENSNSNYIIKDGDIIVVPKSENVVYINLANTKAFDNSSSSESLQKIGVSYDQGKNAKWYIEKYAGGFANQADKKSVLVEYANGATQSTKGGLFKKYPIVENGATITIGSKEMMDTLNGQDNQRSYPKLKKGVIINVNPDGTVTKEEAGNVDSGTEEEVNQPNGIF